MRRTLVVIAVLTCSSLEAGEKVSGTAAGVRWSVVREGDVTVVKLEVKATGLRIVHRFTDTRSAGTLEASTRRRRTDAWGEA